MKVETHYENLFQPNVLIYQCPKREWRWTLNVGAIAIAESSSGYRSRADCIQNLLNIEKRLRELKLQDRIK